MASLNQLSGINAINLYSEVILEEIPQISVQFGVTLLSLANVFGAGLSPLMTRVTTPRNFIIANQFVIGLFLACITVFQITDFPILVLSAMFLTLFSF